VGGGVGGGGCWGVLPGEIVSLGDSRRSTKDGGKKVRRDSAGVGDSGKRTGEY